MADDQIKIRIGLEGDADIKKKLDAVSEASKKAGADISKSMNATLGNASKSISESVPTGGLGKAIGAEESFERNRVAAERLRESIHVLHPVLETAGLGISNLGGYARLAGAGLGALGAAIVGSIVVGLLKARDAAEATKRELDALAGGTGSNGLGGPGAKGDSLFAGFKKDADALGTSLEKVLPLARELTDLKAHQEAQKDVPLGWDEKTNNFIPPSTLPRDQQPLTTEQNNAIIKGAGEAGRVGGILPEVSEKQIADLIKGATSGKGVLTPELLDKDKLAPVLGSAVTAALRDAGIISGNIRNTAQLQESIRSGQTEVRGGDIGPALARDEPKFREQSDKTSRSFSEIVDKVTTGIEHFGSVVGEVTANILNSKEARAVSAGLNKTPGEAASEIGKVLPEFPKTALPPLFQGGQGLALPADPTGTKPFPPVS
jgi:hypothetical protein